MNAYKLITNIPGNRKISFHVPADVPVGPVEIILVYQSPSKSVEMNSIEKLCGSLQGSVFNTERYLKMKRAEKELER
ncbi:MAG: hypothetical protein WDA74_02030 [Spirochaetota bacterium]